MNDQIKRISFNLAQYRELIEARLSEWTQHNFLERLWNKDHTLWSAELVPELVDRLGWLTLPDEMIESLDGILQLVDEVKSEGISRVVLLGMGGSSLAPELFSGSFGSAQGYPGLIVLDSTHPDAVVSVRDRLDLESTLFIVSSKSGTTLETMSLFRYFWEEMNKSSSKPGKNFVAISDPGSPLINLAKERNFRVVFEAPADVGGRFSALSVFGLVPAALIGMDLRSLLERALSAVAECSSGAGESDSSALILGAMLGELAQDRNKITFITSPSLRSFCDWVEQLIAESTGKEGKGIVPVVNEPSIPVESYGDDRLFVGLFLEGENDSTLENSFLDIQASGIPTIRITLQDRYDLGREFFRWEVAVSAACSVMGINPFNQPDVQLSKNYTRRIMDSASSGGEPRRDIKSASAISLTPANEESLNQRLEEWIGSAQPGDYISLQAFLAPSPDVENALQGIRGALLERTQLATTLGYGPRYLHSTGQLHKGGLDCGLFLQLVAKPRNNVKVPETDFTFDAVIRAQGIGDFSALIEGRRRILRVDLGENVLEGLEVLRKLIPL